MADLIVCKKQNIKEKNELTASKMSLLDSLDWLERPPMVEEIEENEEEFVPEPQVSFFYGGNEWRICFYIIL